ncbi:MAG: PPC domain-containing DNA-binding protein [Clostridia bacterium]
MHWKLLNDDRQRTYLLVFETGDEPMQMLAQFAMERNIGAASFTAIGAFSDAVLGYFDWERKDYLKNNIGEQVEVLSLVGDVALADGKPKAHAHVVLGRRDAAAIGGHLLEARVRPTLEVVLVESPAHLVRRHDAESGLALIALDRRA